MRKTYNLAILSILAASAFATASGQHGVMHGGQQPITGARVYVLTAAKSTTPGTASVSLLTSGDGSDQIGWYVLTQQNTGDFNIPPYNCPTADTPIYLYSAGGNAGYGTNAAISEAVYVGPCSGASQAYIYMNEVTTVALDYAVAGYATDPVHISYSGSQASLTGIENAFANASNLADSASGYANSTIPSGSAQAPQNTVNILADALASCINEASQTPNTSNCATLFSAASVNGVAPIDTASAVMNIAHNPTNSTSAGKQNGTNIAQILGLAQNYEQFSIDLSSPPNDLTLSLTFSNGGIAEAYALAIDGSGDAWIASQPAPNSNVSSVVEIASPTNMQLNNATYLASYTPRTEEPYSIAVDAQSQNIWIGTGNAVEEFSTTTGAPAPGSPFLENDSNSDGFYALNLDSAGNVWLGANTTIYELSATGSILSQNNGSPGGYPLPAGQYGAAQPSSLALDASNHVWVTDFVNNALLELSPQGALLANLGQSTTSNFNVPFGVAINAQQDVWVANEGNNYATAYIPNGQTQFAYFPVNTVPPGEPSPYLSFVGMDGAGNSWFSLQSAFCSSTTTCLGVAEVSGTGQPLSGPGYTMVGYQPTGSATATATAIDGSGDVWILNTSAESVTELIGAAVPVVTPLALAVSSNSLGSRP